MRQGKGKTADQPVPSVIAADMSVTGDLVSRGDVHIDGTIEGDVRGRRLVIGEQGRVKGELVAQAVTAHGRIEGTVRARDLTLSDTASVEGDVHHETLEIARGARVAGSIHQESADSPNQRGDDADEGEPAKGGPLKVVEGASGKNSGA